MLTVHLSERTRRISHRTFVILILRLLNSNKYIEKKNEIHYSTSNLRQLDLYAYIYYT